LVDKLFLDSEESKTKYPFLEGTCGPRQGLVEGKDWAKVLGRFFPKEEVD